jgi:hypothetical protein
MAPTHAVDAYSYPAINPHRSAQDSPFDTQTSAETPSSQSLLPPLHPKSQMPWLGAASVRATHSPLHGYYDSTPSNRSSEAYCAPGDFSSSTPPENYSRSHSHTGGIPSLKLNARSQSSGSNAHSRASRNRWLPRKLSVSVCHSQRLRLCRYFLLLPNERAKESHRCRCLRAGPMSPGIDASSKVYPRQHATLIFNQICFIYWALRSLHFLVV